MYRACSTVIGAKMGRTGFISLFKTPVNGIFWNFGKLLFKTSNLRVTNWTIRIFVKLHNQSLTPPKRINRLVSKKKKKNL